MDVIVYVYDSSDTNSFSYISNLRVCFFNTILIVNRANVVILAATIQFESYTNIIRFYQIGSRLSATGKAKSLFSMMSSLTIIAETRSST